jgi:hypothetical protein
LWEEHRLRVFNNLVLRKILRPKTDEVAEDWEDYGGELYDLYSSRNTIP